MPRLKRRLPKARERSVESARRGPRCANHSRHHTAVPWQFEVLEDRLVLDDGFANSFDTAEWVTLSEAGAAVESRAIETPHDEDWFKFTAPGGPDDPARRLTVTQHRVGASQLDSVLATYNSSDMLIRSSDDMLTPGATGPTGDSQVEILVRPGQTYYVRASGFYVSTGEYELAFVLGGPADDFPNTTLDAHQLAISAQEIHSFVGEVNPATDRDAFSFVAQSTGPIAIAVHSLSGSELDPFLTLYDSLGSAIATDDNGGGRVGSFLEFDGVAGTRYFFDVSAARGTDGKYAVTVNTGALVQDDFPDTAAGSGSIVVSSSGRAGQFGTIDQSRDRDLFHFVAPFTGEIDIAVRAFPASILNAKLTAFDAGLNQLAENDDIDDQTLDSLIRLSILAGETYYLRAEGAGTSFGDYMLTFGLPVSLDDFANDIAGAYALNYPPSGQAAVSARVDSPGDVDVFGFHAPLAGAMTITLAPSNTSPVVGRLTLLDDAGNEITAGGGRIEFDAEAGQQYFLRAGSDDNSIGDYRIDWAIDSALADDFGNTQANAATVLLSDTGNGAQSGTIDPLGDFDWFTFVAPTTGAMTLTRAAATGSTLVSQVNLRNEDGSFTDVLSTTDTTLAFTVTEGERYFVRVRAPLGFSEAESVGGYDLFWHMVTEQAEVADDFGNDAASALDVSVTVDQPVTISGTVETGDDVDYFRFVASLDGTVIVSMTASAGSLIESVLNSYGADGMLIRRNEGHEGSLDALVAFVVRAGESYLVSAEGFGDTTGGYDLTFQMIPGGLIVTKLGEESNGAELAPADLITALLGESPGLTVDESSIRFVGDSRAAGSFTGGAGILDTKDPLSQGFGQGIILATGRADNAIGPNFSRVASNDLSIQGGEIVLSDADKLLFQKLLPGADFRDPSILAFDFIPTTNVIEFSFVFASEEYHEFVGKGFSDVFGLFVNDVNYARVQGTDTYIAGTGDVVSVNTVNLQTNGAFFVDNSFRPTAPFGPINIEYDGLTAVIKVRAPVDPGVTNKLAFVIADVRDNLLDSAVFLRAESLRSMDEEVEDAAGRQLGLEFTAIINQVEANGAQLTEAQQHEIIHQELVRRLLKEQGQELVGHFLVVPIDPVNSNLTTPSGQTLELGPDRAADPGSVIPNAFYTRVGTNELLVIPNASLGQYTLELAGAGATGAFRIGASLVDAGGNVNTVLRQGTLRNDNAVAVLDFRSIDNSFSSVTVNSGALRPTVPPFTGGFATVLPDGGAPPPLANDVSRAFGPATQTLTAVLSNLITVQNGNRNGELTSQASLAAGGVTGQAAGQALRENLERGREAGGAPGLFDRLMNEVDRYFPDARRKAAAIPKLVDEFFARLVPGNEETGLQVGKTVRQVTRVLPGVSLPMSILELLQQQLSEKKAEEKPEPKQPETPPQRETPDAANPGSASSSGQADSQANAAALSPQEAESATAVAGSSAP